MWWAMGWPPPRSWVSSGSPFEKTIGFCRAIRIGERVVVSGTAPVWPDGSVDPDPYIQARRCFEIIVTALGEAGATVDDVVRTRMYVTDIDHWQAVGRAHGEVFRDIRPASTLVAVKQLVDPTMLVEIEAEAILPE